VSILPVDGISRGDHVCAVLDGPAAQQELVTEFVGAGLRRHERVAYFAGDASRERVLRMLQAGGISTAEPLANGQLLVLRAEDAAGGEREFDPAARVAGLNAAIDAALAEGYTGFRATGEQWAKRDLPPEDVLVEYETMVGGLCAARGSAGLCQYDATRCEQPLLERMRGLHEHVVRNPLVSSNALLRIVPLCEDAQGNSWLRVVGEADLSNSSLLLAALDESSRGDLHLDLARLRFMDLRGIEALEELRGVLRRSQRRLILHNSPATLRRIIDVLGGSLHGLESLTP
jgi:anti-anti-sigma regulatory factor